MREISKNEGALLFKLYRGRFFGRKHLLIDNLLHGYPPEETGELRAALEKLIRDGIVRRKRTEHGDAVFLSPDLGREIYASLEGRYSWLPPPPWARR